MRTAFDVVRLQVVFSEKIILNRSEQNLLVLHQARESMLHGLFKCQDDVFLASISGRGG